MFLNERGRDRLRRGGGGERRKNKQNEEGKKAGREYIWKEGQSESG